MSTSELLLKIHIQRATQFDKKILTKTRLRDDTNTSLEGVISTVKFFFEKSLKTNFIIHV